MIYDVNNNNLKGNNLILDKKNKQKNTSLLHLSLKKQKKKNSY